MGPGVTGWTKVKLQGRQEGQSPESQSRQDFEITDMGSSKSKGLEELGLAGLEWVKWLVSFYRKCWIRTGGGKREVEMWREGQRYREKGSKLTAPVVADWVWG